MKELDVEKLAAKFHDIYQQEAKRQEGVRHKDAYADLPENIKGFDRVLARYILSHERLTVTTALRCAAHEVRHTCGQNDSIMTSHTEDCCRCRILALIPPTDAQTLDAYVQEKVDRAVLTESEWWAKAGREYHMGVEKGCPSCERLAANRAKVAP